MARPRLSVVVLSALLAGAAQAADNPAPQPTLAQSLDASVRDAQLKRTAGDYAGAVRVLSQLMLAAPDDPRVVGEYGKVLVQQGRSREAIDFLTRAVQLQPADWMLFSALGVAYDQLGDYARARAAYDRALQIKPDEAVVLNNYAMSRMFAGDLAQARQLMMQAAARGKDERFTHNLKLVNGLTPAAPARPAANLPPPPAAKNAAGLADHAPARLTQPAAAAAQPVPVDAKAMAAAGSKAPAVHKPKPHKVARTKGEPKPLAGDIPALRLANDRQ